jgi:hypothetical protein
MAKVVFQKSGEHLIGSIVTIFKNEGELLASKMDPLLYTVKEIPDSEYQNVILGKKRIVNCVNNAVIYENIDGDFYKNKEDLKIHILFYINQIDNLLINRPDHWNQSKLSLFLNVLKNFNYEEIQYPMTETFQEHLNSKNIEILNIVNLI